MMLEERTADEADNMESMKHLMVFRRDNTDYIIYYLQEEIKAFDCLPGIGDDTLLLVTTYADYEGYTEVVAVSFRRSYKSSYD